jgi:hypothetical protein
MHVSCISHTWFIYNLNTIFYLHNIYKEMYAPCPFLITPFCRLEFPPLSLGILPLLTWGNPSFVSWHKFPSILVPGWLYTDPPFLTHSLTPLPTVPRLECMPSYDDSAISASHSPIQLDMVFYNYCIIYIQH